MLINHKLLKIAFLAIIAVTGVSGCGSGDNSSAGGESVKSIVAIPSAIKAAALPNTGTMTAKVFVDGSSSAAVSQTVDVAATNVKFILTVASGNHNFTVVFYYDDLVFAAQTWELARATSSTVNVSAGGTTNVPLGAYDYQDYDGDGEVNLTELDESVRTDPGVPLCKLDNSIAKLDQCNLG